jgi:hypothetical protein
VRLYMFRGNLEDKAEYGSAFYELETWRSTQSVSLLY